MNWWNVTLAVALTGATIWSVLTMRQLRRELKQARRLYEQMEEDHAELVSRVIAADPANKVTRIPPARRFPPAAWELNTLDDDDEEADE